MPCKKLLTDAVATVLNKIHKFDSFGIITRWHDGGAVYIAWERTARIPSCMLLTCAHMYTCVRTHGHDVRMCSGRLRNLLYILTNTAHL